MEINYDNIISMNVDDVNKIERTLF